MKASPWSGACNSVVEVPGFYSKMKAERTSQRRSDETMNSTAARATPLSSPSDLPQAQYGNNTADPIQLHMNPGPAPTLNLTFDQ